MIEVIGFGLVHPYWDFGKQRFEFSYASRLFDPIQGGMPEKYS